IHLPPWPGSTNVGGAPGNFGVFSNGAPEASSTTARRAHDPASTSIGHTLASIRSARKGFTSIVVERMPRNWAASAVVPQPPKGSTTCAISPDVSLTALATSSGVKDSLNLRQPWKAKIEVPAFVPRVGTERPLVQSSNRKAATSG